MNIIGLGDSLLQFNDSDTFPQTGWFQLLPRFVKDPVEIQCLDFAKNGSSTKSIQTLGFYDKAKKHCSKGDVVIIEFGHNDEKEYDPDRYTRPFIEYEDNLIKFYNEFTALGARVIFCTPVSRVKYEEDGIHIKYTHGDYPSAMKEAARKTGALLIDLENLSKASYEKGGYDFTHRCIMYFKPGEYPNYPEGKEDTTHLTYFGAMNICSLFAGELSHDEGLCKLLHENKIRSASPNMPFEP